MSKRSLRFKKDPGPNPDPEKYILVESREGSYWRRKRGTVKPALLNATLQQSADSIKVCSPAAKRMQLALGKSLRGLRPRRLIARASALFKKAYLKNGRLDFSFFEDFDFQEERLYDLVQARIECSVNEGIVEVKIPVAPWSIRRKNPLVTELYFDLVLLYGDLTKQDGLTVEEVTSPLYSYDTKVETICTLSIALPGTTDPWMVMLKVSSLEGNEIAIHQRHYGMKVVAHNH